MNCGERRSTFSPSYHRRRPRLSAVRGRDSSRIDTPDSVKPTVVSRSLRRSKWRSIANAGSSVAAMENTGSSPSSKPRLMRSSDNCKIADSASSRTSSNPLPSLQQSANRSAGGNALLELGVHPRLASNPAGSGLGPWYLARANALSVGLFNAYFKSLGLPTLIHAC